MIYDSHAHLDMIDKNYLPILIENAKKAGVKKIITNTVNPKSFNISLKIKDTYSDIVELAAGLYPEETLELEDYNILENFVKENINKIIALGEIGLDLYHYKENFQLQKQVFIKQLDLARDLNLPVIIHTRKAEKETLEILQNYPSITKILHCFSGKRKLIKQAEEMGCYFTLPTNIVRAENFQWMAKELPREKILTETDTPYLSPFKEGNNEPAFIAESIKKISEIWETSEEKVKEQLQYNYNKIFK